MGLILRDYTFHASRHRVKNCSSRYSFLNDERSVNDTSLIVSDLYIFLVSSQLAKDIRDPLQIAIEQINDDTHGLPDYLKNVSRR